MDGQGVNRTYIRRASYACHIFELFVLTTYVARQRNNINYICGAPKFDYVRPSNCLMNSLHIGSVSSFHLQQITVIHLPAHRTCPINFEYKIAGGCSLHILFGHNCNYRANVVKSKNSKYLVVTHVQQRQINHLKQISTQRNFVVVTPCVVQVDANFKLVSCEPMPNPMRSQQKYPLTINFNVNRLFGQDFIDICYVPVCLYTRHTKNKIILR